MDSKAYTRMPKDWTLPMAIFLKDLSHTSLGDFNFRFLPDLPVHLITPVYQALVTLILDFLITRCF